MNDKYLLFFVLLLGLLGLSSCADRWDKDPFVKEEEAVKNAVPYNKKERRILPPEKNSLFIDVEDSYHVVQGKTLKIPIKYRIVHPEIVYERIEIQVSDNLDMKEVEEFDSENNKFTVLELIPPKTTVDLGSVFKISEVQVTLFAKYESKETETMLSSSKTITVVVTPEETVRGVRPEILGVFPAFDDDELPNDDNGNPHPLNENNPGFFGDLYKFDIYVKGDTEQPPFITFIKDERGYISPHPESQCLFTKPDGYHQWRWK